MEMLHLLLFTVILFSAGMVIGILTRNYQDAIWFIKVLDVDFDYYVNRNPNYSETTKKAIKIIYSKKKPKWYHILVPAKNLHRKNFFTQNEIELFFTRYI